ncbi:MAG: methyltransferase domain-containing protein [Anaerolineaceae bacterium]|nr:MAG: methyltransferase domain-containing protein [Anaerolineaceae bacterium]
MSKPSTASRKQLTTCGQQLTANERNEDSSFHLVTCRIAPHHFGNIPLFVRESARVLRQGGLLAVVDNVVPPGSAGDYVNAFEKLRDPSHGRCLSPEEWTAAFQAAELSVKHQETLPKTMNFQFWAKRHDPITQSYLRSLLTESSGPTAAFLNPQETADGLTFQLLEAITIGTKPEP